MKWIVIVNPLMTRRVEAETFEEAAAKGVEIYGDELSLTTEILVAPSDSTTHFRLGVIQRQGPAGI